MTKSNYISYFHLKNGKGKSPVLRFKKDELLEKALARLKNKWIVGAYHQNHNQTEIHSGELREGVTCQLCEKQTEPEVTKVNYFEPLTTPDDVIRCWDGSDNGLRVFYFMLCDRSVEDPFNYAIEEGKLPLHMTLLYRPCGVNEAICLYFWASEICDLIGKQTIVKIGAENSKVVGKVKDGAVRLPGNIRPMLKRLNIRGWIPHVTDSEQILTEGNDLRMHPYICCIRETGKKVSLFGLSTYLDSLKHGSEGLKQYIEDNKDKSSGYPQ